VKQQKYGNMVSMGLKISVGAATYEEGRRQKRQKARGAPVRAMAA